MRVIICGLGNQGKKRSRVAGDDVCAMIDPIAVEADYNKFSAISDLSFEAGLICTPEYEKLSLIKSLLDSGKHVMVEKPLYSSNHTELLELFKYARANNKALYVAYNHRFEPHIQTAKDLLERGSFGAIYSVKMFYGNGTAQDVRSSPWRDSGLGVLGDLGCHLLDLTLFLLGPKTKSATFMPWIVKSNENKAPDYCLFGTQGSSNCPRIVLEASLLSWRNMFSIEIVCEKGSLLIDSLCKWGRSTLTVRMRKYPSGRPDEKITTIVADDVTWEHEYSFFKDLCSDLGGYDWERDIWINTVMQKLAPELFCQIGGEI
ncbi:Gfo/Idh/MocA family protein [Kiloniella laminariae]|uniref:Gfo/Idh/MocA family protein n=1 Tax=Kiloniella laminariae TaxID=454162 RepID=UPI0003A439E6|nr:Gfo/Idh/MocA family oxidoreductase [Kiloniella laminariae]